MNSENYPLAYACYNKNKDIRLKSTSGGIFTLLAEYVITNCNGIVFGAAFDERYAVKHIMVDNVGELCKLRGSKYSQSIVGNCFLETKKFLDDGRTVFFTGTPCQIEGLKQFLKRDYDNLLCMDFICHGVASPGVWKGYLKEWRDINNIQEIVFKDKIKGWKKWHIKIRYNDHTWYRRGSVEPFMQSFLRYANIRPSCFDCKFKGLKRVSDFTISDCWGIGEQNKRLNDDLGLSALLIQNERAKRIFNEISSDMEYEKYDAEELMHGNWTAFKSVKSYEKRTEFFADFNKRGAKYALHKYFAPKLKNWIKYYYLRLIGKEK